MDGDVFDSYLKIRTNGRQRSTLDLEWFIEETRNRSRMITHALTQAANSSFPHYGVLFSGAVEDLLEGF